MSFAFAETMQDDDAPPRPPWLDWCERNAQPKVYHFPREYREITRWQKRGPMTRRDWVHFYHWAAKNAIAREEYVPKPPKERKKGGDEEGEQKKKVKLKRPPTMQQVYNNCIKLSQPKNPREKYEYPEEEDYPYAPKISRKEPAHRDPGRPIEPPEVPEDFQHIELEIDFWSTLRFPVIRSALKYKASQNILQLAIPKPYPYPLDKLHCPPPVYPPEFIAPRRRMKPRQWKEHMRRLEYLAKPVVRPAYVY